MIHHDTGLRDRLRQDTAPRHARVDEAFSRLDLTRAPDYATFLAAHEGAIAAIRSGTGDGTGVARLLDGLLARLGGDLACLGVARMPRMTVPPLDPLAVRYVIAGSRLGTRTLRRRWERSTDASVRAAGGYVCAPFQPREWRLLCDALARMPARDARADLVVRDAGTAFDAFAAALDRAPCALAAGGDARA